MSGKPRSAIVIASVLAVVLAGTIAGCSTTEGDGETTTVTIGTLRGQPHFYAPFLYEDYGPDDIKFEVITLDSTPALNDALYAGTVDFAITGVTPTIASAAEDRDLRVVASAADGGSGFIARDGIDTVEDLVGKNVAYLAGSVQEVAMRLTLDDAGVDPGSVNLIKMPPTEMANALATGSVDAFFGVEIGASLALANGGHQFADPYATAVGDINIALVTTGALVESDPELVQEVVDTHVATVDAMNSTQDEWLTEMVNTFGGDQEVFSTALENFTLRSSIDDEYLQEVAALAEQMGALGLIQKTPDVDSFVDVQFLTAG